MQQFKVIVLIAAAIRLLPAATTPVIVEQYHPHDFALSAQVGGNPFDVDVRGEFTGPEGTRITVPGFYAGGNRWKTRCPPTKPGRWPMTTLPPVAALRAPSEATIACTANSTPALNG